MRRMKKVAAATLTAIMVASIAMSSVEQCCGTVKGRGADCQ